MNEWMEGEMLSEYITKVSVIHFIGKPADFINHAARNEQQGNQLNVDVSLCSAV